MKNLIAMLSVACIWIAGNPAFGQGTAFTYQGQLQNNGNPANGAYNFTFSLFNANTGGRATAGPVTNNGVMVSNGLFTALIDFGPGVFTGGTDWLEIGVETNGVSAFTTLTPRQQLTPTPYAITSSNALSAGTITGLVPNGGLNGTYTKAVTINNSSNSFGGSFNGNGSSLSNLNASHITSGVISNVSSVNVPTANITNLQINGSVAFANPNLTPNPFTLENIASYESGAALFASAPNSVTAFDLEPGTGPVADIGNGLAHLDICNTNVQASSYFEPASWISIAASTNAHFISSRAYGGGALLPFWLGFAATPVLEFSNGSPATVTAIGDVSISGSLSVSDSVVAGGLTLPGGMATIYSGTDLLLRQDNLQNFFAGGGAGNLSLTGIANTGIGYDALPNNTGGSYNTANGFLALYYNTAGGNNTAIGTGALCSNSIGGYNIAIGNGALFANTIGSYNTAEGVYALYNSTTASNNISVGYDSGIEITTGSSNIDIGNVGAATDANIIRIGSGQKQAVIAGVVTASDGFASYASNLAAPATITLGASPFTYTNTSGQNIEVFIGGGTVKEFAVNGTIVATGLALKGLTTVFLENNETLQVTYSAAPAMTFLVR
jgi:hypothetical protein